MHCHRSCASGSGALAATRPNDWTAPCSDGWMHFFINLLGLRMIRLIFVTAFVMATTASFAQQPPKGSPDPKKVEACRQLARERGFNFNRSDGRAVREFVRGCVRGTQK